jgi:hypothetical protein
MTTLLILGLMCFAALASLVLIPLFLLKTALVVVIALVAIPFKIMGAFLGGLTRVAFKGIFWLALLMVPLALIAFPLTIMAFGAWLLYRALRPRRPSPTYAVAQ